eukprot:FR740062.1.p1 GENE.FR740062.1~~FR740062.1.p1  ORF type:complete len:104 (+),score=20.19 FR740062.1:557-868(+)
MKKFLNGNPMTKNTANTRHVPPPFSYPPPFPPKHPSPSRSLRGSPSVFWSHLPPFVVITAPLLLAQRGKGAPSFPAIQRGIPLPLQGQGLPQHNTPHWPKYPT